MVGEIPRYCGSVQFILYFNRPHSYVCKRDTIEGLRRCSRHIVIDIRLIEHTLRALLVQSKWKLRYTFTEYRRGLIRFAGTSAQF